MSTVDIDTVSALFPDWGKYLGVRAEKTTVPIYDWERKSLHAYELQAMLLVLPAHTTHLKAELLAKLPKIDIPNNHPTPTTKLYLDEITKIVENL